MNTLKCIIADDEPIARQILENYIQDISYLEIVAVCKDAFEVMHSLQDNEVDILILDINMPKLSGLDLLRSMTQKPSVIITTAYPEYAIEGFELAVEDYLLKPFSLARFLQAVTKIQNKKKSTTSPVNSTPQTRAAKSIFVKSDKKIIKLSFDEINYIEAYGNYIKIYNDSMIMSLQTLSDFLEKLPNQYLRIHKSIVINFDKMKMIDGNQIILHNDTKLPIGKSYRNDVLNRIDSN